MTVTADVEAVALIEAALHHLQADGALDRRLLCEALNLASAAILAHHTALLSERDLFVAALERIQDEANTVGGDWRETASLIDSICFSALASITPPGDR